MTVPLFGVQAYVGNLTGRLAVQVLLRLKVIQFPKHLKEKKFMFFSSTNYIYKSCAAR
jgi:hypothetical protein